MRVTAQLISGFLIFCLIFMAGIGIILSLRLPAEVAPKPDDTKLRHMEAQLDDHDY